MNGGLRQLVKLCAGVSLTAYTVWVFFQLLFQGFHQPFNRIAWEYLTMTYPILATTFLAAAYYYRPRRATSKPALRISIAVVATFILAALVYVHNAVPLGRCTFKEGEYYLSRTTYLNRWGHVNFNFKFAAITESEWPSPRSPSLVFDGPGYKGFWRDSKAYVHLDDYLLVVSDLSKFEIDLWRKPSGFDQSEEQLKLLPDALPLCGFGILGCVYKLIDVSP